MDQDTLRLLEFPEVLQLMAPLADTPLAREGILQMTPLKGEEQIRSRLQLLEETLTYFRQEGRLRFSGLTHPQPLQQKLALGGESLEAEEILQVQQYLYCARRLREALSPRRWPRLSEAFVPPADFGPLLSRIEACLDPSGEVKDGADPELAAVRRRLGRLRSQIETQLSRFLRGPQARYLIQEPFITSRNGRFVLPVRVEHQKEVPGIVHASSSSGATLFVEPLQTLELNNRLLAAQEEEARIVARVLRELTRQIRGRRRDWEDLLERVKACDLAFALCEFAERHACILPCLSEDGSLQLRGARHPLLMAELGEATVPIDVELSPRQRVMVISGPNTGGKTVALKTVGLLSLMAQAGLPVPAREARIPCFRSVLADIGDHQSIAHHLSTFSAHIRRLVHILENLHSPALVLLDEVGTGTDPVHGAALAIALLDHLRVLEVLTVATTHLPQVKAFAFSTPGMVSARVELDAKGRPTYQLRPGLTGESNALQMALSLGLPAALAERARERLNEQDLLIERLAARLNEEVQDLEQERRRLEEERRRLIQEEVQARRRWEEEKKKLLERNEKALREWEKRYEEQAARLLRSLQDKLQAQRLKKEWEGRQALLRRSFQEQLKHPSQGPDQPPPEWEPGCLVFHQLLRQKGTLVRVQGEEALLDIQGKRVSTSVQHLRPAQEGSLSQSLPAQVKVFAVEEGEPELNVIGCSVEETLERADKFLDRAFLSRLSEVRIIHGFGTGKLRKALSRFLASHPQVQAYRVEGGSTLVEMRL